MLNNKIAWLESQFLFPQHFQQQERYLEGRIEKRSAAIRPYVWGIRELRLNDSALGEGKLALTEVSGIMPDGTPFELPHSAALPVPLQLPQDLRNQRIYLGLPMYQQGARLVELQSTGEADSVARYRLQTTEVFDYCAEVPRSEPVETIALNFRLLLESEELGGYSVLPIAHVREVTPEGAVVLETNHIPPCVDALRQPRLSGYLNDTVGLLKQRADALAARFNQPAKAGGASAIADFLLLQLTNRYEARLQHLAALALLPPERLYVELVTLVGELATFTTEAKRPATVAAYRHDDLQGSFLPLIDALGQQLSAVLEQTAISLPVEERQFGIHVARITDRTLLTRARFVLAVKGDIASDILRSKLPGLLKVGAVETIRTLVNNQLPGVGVSTLPVAPREIPYHAGSVYLELDSSSEQWQQLHNSGGFAFHLAGDFPSLKLELWAIRQ